MPLLSHRDRHFMYRCHRHVRIGAYPSIIRPLYFTRCEKEEYEVLVH
jgi:hypothetical protein